MTKLLSIAAVAAICHAANKAYCEGLGDPSQLDWEYAPDWQKNSAINGVKFHLDNPGASPAASHENWRKEREADGWKYGEEKNPDLKEHPCFLPFDELPKEQQAKDYLFKTIVNALVAVIDQTELDDQAAAEGRVAAGD